MDSDASLVAEEHKLHEALVRLLKSVKNVDLIIKYKGALEHLEFLAPWTIVESSDSESAEEEEEEEEDDDPNPIWPTSWAVKKRMLFENRIKDSQDRRTFMEENRYIIANVHQISSSNDDAENAVDSDDDQECTN